MHTQKVRVSHGIIFNDEAEVSESTTRIFTWANAMTFSGIVALCIAAWLVAFGSSGYLWLVPWLFGYGAGVSDALDGIIAKLTNSYTRLGRIMDPFRDRATIAFIALALWHTQETLFWIICFPLVLAIEARVAYLNKKKRGVGSHAWSKRRYLVHLVVMGQYITQTYWSPWPTLVDGFWVGVVMAFGSALALPVVYNARLVNNKKVYL